MRRIPAATLLLALALLPAHAAAVSAPACPCFKDRTFDPIRPAAADPYILATTRSSLLSAAYGVPKADLVQAVMTGTDPDDLWVAHWAAARTGASARSLLDAREKAGSWQAALGGARAARLGPAFEKALAAGAG